MPLHAPANSIFDYFFDCFSTSVLTPSWTDFGANLAPTWLPKSVQEGSKSLQKCIQICILVLILFLIDFSWILVDFGSQNAPKMEPSWVPRAMKTATSENTKIIKRPIGFSMILVVSGGRSWSQNPSKIGPYWYQKQDQIFNGFWTALGSILDRFWIDFGGQVGAKLALKSVQEGVNTDVKKR